MKNTKSSNGLYTIRTGKTIDQIKMIGPLGALFLQKQSKGALSVLKDAFENSLKGGEHIGPDGFQEMRGNPMIVDSDDYSKNTEIAESSWKVSEDMTNVSYLRL